MLFNLFNREPQLPKVVPGAIKPVVLLVLDGFGIAPPSPGNAVTQAKTPNYKYFLANFPHGQLIASGESVGLPANEEGNSEVGHLTMGVGRVVLQSLMRIKAAIEDKSFFENDSFTKALAHAATHNSKLHIMGLVGTGEVHSAIAHFYTLLELCQKKQVKEVCLHLFTDGRDAPPQEGKEIIPQIVNAIKNTPNIKIATIAGRYYAMDRDRRWERTQLAYEAIVEGKGPQFSSPLEAVEATYAEGKSDEFILPSVMVKDGKPVGTVADNDAIIFFNFRIDRPRQLTMAFTMPDFEDLKHFELELEDSHHEGRPAKKKEVVAGPTFKRTVWPKNLFFVTMTEYQKNIPVSAIAFPPFQIEDSLSRVLSDHSKKHLHLTESEKERMVTYYFDGMKEERTPGEDVLIVPSPKVATYDKKPDMSTKKIVKEFITALNKSNYHFFVMNFACPDMVGHTGNLKAAIRAVEAADQGLGQIAYATLAAGGTFLMSADHGNVEELMSYPTGSFYFTTAGGEKDTSHSNNPVPILIVSPELKGKPKQLMQGTLSDIAPTILGIMDLPVPAGMTGRNLLEGIS